MTRTPLIDKLLDRRLADPVRFADRVRQRPRATWSPTEPLMVVAADHPARGALAAGGRADAMACLLYTSPSPRDGLLSRMPSSA